MKSLKLRRVGYCVLDSLWPTLHGPDRKSSLTVDLPHDATEEAIERALQEIGKLIEDEEKRRESVNTRLLALLPLAPTVAGLVFSLLVYVRDLFHAHENLMLMGFIVNIYIVVQMGCLTKASISGLNRRGYRSDTVDDLLPGNLEDRRAFLERRFLNQANTVNTNLEPTNEKVSQMALGFRALFNTVSASLILVIAFLVIVLFNPVIVTKSEPAIGSTLSAIEHRLQDLAPISAGIEKIADNRSVVRQAEETDHRIDSIEKRLLQIESVSREVKKNE